MAFAAQDDATLAVGKDEDDVSKRYIYNSNQSVIIVPLAIKHFSILQLIGFNKNLYINHT